jgi:CBS domain containing-hemolysin-like protein
MPGDVHVDEVERALGTDLPRGDYETIAGLVIAHHGGLPEEGATLEIELPPDPADLVHDDEPTRRVLQVQVLAVDRHVPSRVRLRLPETADTHAPAAAAGEEDAR